MIAPRLLIAATALTAFPAIAAAPAAAAPVPIAAAPDAHYEKAYAFVQSLNPLGRVRAEARQGYFQGLHSDDPQAAALEAQFPGILDEFGEATFPFVMKLLEDGLPELWRRQAELIAAEMSDAEIDQCIAFYGSPVGQRMAEALLGAFTGDNIAAQATADPENPRVTADALRSDVAAAIPGVLRSLSASDREAIVAFGMTPAGRRISVVNSRLMTIMADWINELIASPALNAEFSRQAEAIVGRRMQAASQ